MADIALVLCPTRATVRHERRRAMRSQPGSGVQHVRTVNDRPVKVHGLAYSKLGSHEAQSIRDTFNAAKGCVLPVDLTLPDASVVEVHLPSSITIRHEAPQHFSCSFEATEVR